MLYIYLIYAKVIFILFMKDTTQHAFTKWFTVCFWFLILKKKPKKHNHECKKTHIFPCLH